MSSARNEEIVRRYMAGEAMHEIGADYGISRQRVQQIARKAGARPRRRRSGNRPPCVAPELTAEVAHALNRAGLTRAQIASLCGVCEETVKRRAAPAGRLPGVNRKLSDAEVAEIRRLLMRGERAAALAQRYGVVHTTIWEIKHGRRRKRAEAGWSPEFEAWANARKRGAL